jgi:sugar phosphate isomerase/epimerase
MKLNRRELLAGCLGALPAFSLAAEAEDAPTRPLGLVENCYGLRQAADRWGGSNTGLNEPLQFLEKAARKGAGGVQFNLRIRRPDYMARVRKKLEELHLYLEGMVRLPKNRMELGHFTSEVETAKEAGATILRTVLLSGRRYETFTSQAAFRTWADQAWQALVLAEPVVAQQKMLLAVENHKDLRVEEFLPLLERLNSRHVGVCVDTANSIALLEDPMEVIEAYAPWAFSTHLKDVAVAEYEEGFLLAEVPLGEGFLDVKRIAAILRKAKPDIHLNLEMITRDPLKIPCLTPGYWETFPNLPGRHLARTMAWVRKNLKKSPLPRVSGLSDEDKLAVEESNVQKSLAYAGKHL